MIKLYGIPNCDTMKKARLWLSEHGVAYEFHDYKKEPPTEPQLRAWVAELGWERLLNRKGQLWRKLDPAVREVMDEARAIEVMLAQPGIIKRPLLALADGTHRVGFDPATYDELFR